MDAIRTLAMPTALALVVIAWAGTTPVFAADAEGAHADPPHSAMREAQPPWLQPIRDEFPIRRMSSLKTEYRRIRELRRTQVQPEYERRMADGDDADAWRERTLREVARRDLRDLRARLDR